MRHLLFGAWLLWLSGAQSTPPRPAPPGPAPASSGVNFFSRKQDVEIGTESAAQAEKQLAMVRDAAVNQYVRAVAQRLLTTTPQKGMTFQFKVVNSAEVNSLGFPNGSIYIYRGLLSLAANDDELAAVIAHEIAHIVLRHATMQLSRQLLVQAPIFIAAGLPSEEGWKDRLSALGVSFGANAEFLHYSPGQESEAAGLAKRMMTAAHFDPEALTSVFQKSASPFVDNHPMAGTVDMEATVRRTRVTSPYRIFQQGLLRLPKPPIVKPVATAPEVDLPNVFQHPLNYYHLNFPEGWQVTSTMDNGAIVAPANGVQTSRTGSDLSLGVMFDIFPLPASETAPSLEQATNRLLVSLRQRNPSLRAVPGAQTPILFRDEPGLRTVMMRRSCEETRPPACGVMDSGEIVWVVTRMYYQNMFYMLFVASADEFPSHQQIFERIIRSVQVR